MDLQGLKAALLACCHARGLTAGEVVRQALASYLALPSTTKLQAPCAAPSSVASRATLSRTRISLRLAPADAAELQQLARESGLSLGTWIVQRMRTGRHPASAQAIASARAALTASNAELAALSRNLAHLTALLRQGEVRAAQQYREVLDSAQADIRRHLREASRLAAQLRPPAKANPENSND